MQISHVISDLILCLIAFFVFFRYLVKLNISETILWESFVLSVGMAAVFGCFRFAGFDNAVISSRFFQNLASMVGVVGLVVGIYVTVNSIHLTKITSYVVLAVGFVLFAVADIFKIHRIFEGVPVVGMFLILCLGIMALIKGKIHLGYWIILGVLFFAIASFRYLFVDNRSLAVDLYHYFTAAGLLCLGKVTTYKSMS